MKLKDGHDALGAGSTLVFTSYTWNAIAAGKTHYRILHPPPSPLHTQEFKSETSGPQPEPAGAADSTAQSIGVPRAAVEVAGYRCIPKSCKFHICGVIEPGSH